MYHVIHAVELSKAAKKQLASVPTHVVDKLFDWVQAVEKFGLEAVRQRSGLHDVTSRSKAIGSVGVEVAFVKEVTHHAY